MRWLYGLALGLLAVVVGAERVPAAWAQGGQVRVTLFHDTHIHGNLQAPDGVTFAHYVGLMKQLRAALPAPGHSLFLGNGDDVAASPMSLVAGGGMHIVDSLNASGIDADTIGTDEFHIGVAPLRALLAASRFPWVTANVRDTHSGEPFGHEAGTRRWIIKEVGGVRFGLTGAVAPDPPAVARAGPDVRILDPVDALHEVVPQLRAAGAQVVVLLAHLCRADIERVAAAVDGIDVAVGTHCSGEVLEQPRVVNGTIISQRGHDLELLGQLDLAIQGGRVVGHTYRAHRLTTNAPTDPAVAAVQDRYRSAAEAALAVPVGATATTLDPTPTLVRSGEATAGNLIADALRAWAGSDVGLLYAGSIRPGARPLAPGPLVRQDVLDIVSWPATAVVLRVTGAQLVAALENGVSRVEQQDVRFPHVSGMTFAFDPAAPAGARVVGAWVGGRPVAPADRYALATTHFAAVGAAGYERLRTAEVVAPASAGPLLVQVVLDYLAAQGTVTPTVEGRIRVAGAAAAAARAPAALPRALPRTGDARSLSLLAPPLVVGGALLLIGTATHARRRFWRWA
jgi:2',3'-cyclic-nucleotide 2'-phosphodiesterase/3'-nucleotidase